MTTYSTIRINEFGKAIKDSKVYKTKQQAINASNSWIRNSTVHSEIRKLRSAYIIENN